MTGAVNVPIFQGGRARGRLLEADADLRSRRAEAEDLKASIYYEVRAAFLDLQAGNEQQCRSRHARAISPRTQLTQARDRFAAGVASNIEVVQAQEAVAPRQRTVHRRALRDQPRQGALVRGVGIAEDTARQLLGGAR